ncbi:protocadherin-10-like isoform X3 [Colius striatus]|uniref:protocadherin-10-like isoform X3 n=1 Tax=Colius striatus TaxID=57412 RepID=UPI002B1E4D14|nr:protocadherin-10-like isoform X3 [Colius striatus]
MGAGAGSGPGRLFLRSLLFLLLCAAPAGGQLRYAVPEELEHGAFVANLGEDLGLDVSTLSARRFRIVSRAGARQHLEVNLENGILFVNERIDREEVCEAGDTCLLHLQLLVESPLELYRVEVEVLDINDHAPTFPWQEYALEVAESALLGARFPLESAHDPDVGSNSVHTYRLSPNAFFSLEVQTRSDGSKFAELVLERGLDREQQRTHRVLLTALDGGVPARSGTARVLVTVLDANDNVPAFDQPSYGVSLPEDAPAGTLVIQLNATDLDEGPNGEIEYSFSGHAPPRARELFHIEPRSGQVLLKGPLDYERASLHELYVQAKDRGPSAVAVHCRVLVQLLDVNDNAPEVTLTSVSTPVLEDAPPGTVIAVISVLDRDSGDNGRVSCEVGPDVPFELRSSFRNYYTLVTTRALDREAVAEYNVSITARDMGSPALLTRSTLTVPVSDVNDNAPRFLQPSYSVYVMENNAPGASICSVSASDPDCQQNAYLSYSIADGHIHGMPVGTYVSINSDSGHMYALRSLDYEQIRSFQVQLLQATDFTLFSVAPDTGELRTLRSFLEQDATRQQLVVQVRDSGQPALSATVSLLLSVVETMPQTLSDFSEFSLPPETTSSSPFTLYLLVSLGSISFTFLLAILILTAVRCRGARRSLRGEGCSATRCHCCPGARQSSDGLKTSNLTAQPAAGTSAAACLDVPGGGPPGYCYKVCLGPESAQSDFMFLKPCSPPRNNEKGPRKWSQLGQHLQVSNQMKQPNMDWLPPGTQRPALKSSQSLEDVGEIHRALQKEHERLCTLVTPVSEFQKASAGTNSIWTPQCSPLYPGHIPALDYQHNVYIPGTPTLLSSKDGPLFLGQENKNSFSTFGKRKKMPTYCDMHDSVVINNDLK